MYGDSSGQPDHQATWGVTDFSQAKDGQGNSIDDYATKIMSPMSTMAAGIKANGTVTVGNAPAQNGYVRYKYDYNQYAESAGTSPAASRMLQPRLARALSTRIKRQ